MTSEIYFHRYINMYYVKYHHPFLQLWDVPEYRTIRGICTKIYSNQIENLVELNKEKLL
jgi:hypothetical protein